MTSQDGGPCLARVLANSSVQAEFACVQVDYSGTSLHAFFISNPSSAYGLGDDIKQRLLAVALKVRNG